MKKKYCAFYFAAGELVKFLGLDADTGGVEVKIIGSL